MLNHQCPLVMIEWEDSAHPTSKWAYLQNFEPPKAINCISVGWLIHDGEVKAVAQNMGNLTDADSAQISGVIHIPARCIIRQTRLQEPDTIFAPSSRPAKGRKRPTS